MKATPRRHWQLVSVPATGPEARWCRTQGDLPDTPSLELSEVRKQIVILRNIRGLMGRYCAGRAGRLRRVENQKCV